MVNGKRVSGPASKGQSSKRIEREEGEENMREVMEKMDNELFMYDQGEKEEDKDKLSHIPTDAVNLDAVVMKNLLDSFISENKMEPGPASLLFKQVGLEGDANDFVNKDKKTE